MCNLSVLSWVAATLPPAQYPGVVFEPGRRPWSWNVMNMMKMDEDGWRLDSGWQWFMSIHDFLLNRRWIGTKALYTRFLQRKMMRFLLTQPKSGFGRQDHGRSALNVRSAPWHERSQKNGMIGMGMIDILAIHLANLKATSSWYLSHSESFCVHAAPKGENNLNQQGSDRPTPCAMPPHTSCLVECCVDAGWREDPTK